MRIGTNEPTWEPQGMLLAVPHCPDCVEKSAEITKHAIDLKIVTATGAVVLFVSLVLGYYAHAYWKEKENEAALKAAAPTFMQFLGETEAASKVEGQTKEQLYKQATLLNIKGRSRMNKSQLLAAVNRVKS